MNKVLGILAAIAIIIVGLSGYMISSYNDLIALREEVNTSWSKVQSNYQRRSELIPNLVKTVQGAAGFEQQTLERVIKARASATQITVNPENAADMAKFQQSQGELSSALSRLLVVSEQYPQLQAVQGFRDFQIQLEGTENRISVARNDYGDVAKIYNKKRNSFPTIILASFFGFTERPYFEADTSAQKAPTVDFSTNPMSLSGSTL